MTGDFCIQVSSISELKDYKVTDIAVAIGVFDGVHLGHKKLIDALLKMSDGLNATPVVMTFFPHPRELLHPMTPPVQLIPPDEKYRILCSYGARAIITIPFTREFAALEPEQFIDDCLHADGVRIHGICVGSKWRFGALGKGNTALLARIAQEKGFAFQGVDELKLGEETVSSTAVRHAIAAGDFRTARALLGRPYRLYGTVVHGHGVAGTRLEHPTANLEVEYGVGTRYGVYAAFAEVGEDRYPAVVAIGVAPTFSGYGQNRPRIEIHFLNFTGNLYEKEVRLDLIEFLRDERKFESPEALKAQIGKDIESATTILNAEMNHD